MNSVPVAIFPLAAPDPALGRIVTGVFATSVSMR